MDPPADSEQFHLSHAALGGQPSPRTLQLQGTIQHLIVTILIYSGSSHNILQPRIVEFLGLPILALNPFSVLVGNGDLIRCAGSCADVPLTLTGELFKVSFFILPIHGADVVLGSNGCKH